MNIHICIVSIHLCIYTHIYDIGKVVQSESISIGKMDSAILIYPITSKIVFRYTKHRW